MLHGIIMAGGAGTRFWPASRASLPKQLLALSGTRSMLQSTVDRLSSLIGNDRLLIVANQRLVQPIRDQLPDLPLESVIGEPCKRDTAPCIGLAAGWVLRSDPDATMVVMPSDHVIEPDEQFQGAILHAARIVEQNPRYLVTFGIKPTYPAESFGYVERGEPLTGASSDDSPRTYHVLRFREKPREAVAKKYVAAGNFLWNAGIFVWKARTILDYLARFEPEMHRHVSEIIGAIGSEDFEDVFARRFAAIQGRSIDFAVMERADDVVVVEAPFKWDDLGSWQALCRLIGTDDDGNTVQGKHLGIDTRRTLVRGTDDHLIVTLGVNDLIVVQTPDATLVADKHREEEIRKVVSGLEERDWTDYL